MNLFANIRDSVVVGLINSNDDTWYDAILVTEGTDVQEGYLYQNGTFIAPLKTQASNALVASDLVVIRCYSSSIPVPSEWNTYRNSLRGIVNGTDTTSTVLPTRPSYPPGT
jgi:hypothetical protein